MRTEVTDFCVRIGSDRLLVQGAGGNVSWKDGETLWIKASGTWLVDAADKDIFVAADLAHLQAAVAVDDFDVTPTLRIASSFRPSIETLLHALMPQAVVVHLHAIEVLAHLVRQDFEDELRRKLSSLMCWTHVSYCKPGPALARACHAALAATPNAEVVFLQNHGIVIGAASIARIDSILCALTDALSTPPRMSREIDRSALPLTIDGDNLFLPVSDVPVHQLAIDHALFDRLASDWALFPDHVVFLGASANAYDSVATLREALAHAKLKPELVFIRGLGVFARADFNFAKQAQLRCYYDVLSRQADGCVLNSLDIRQIGELLNWDAEHYRMNNSR